MIIHCQYVILFPTLSILHPDRPDNQFEQIETDGLVTDMRLCARPAENCIIPETANTNVTPDHPKYFLLPTNGMAFGGIPLLPVAIPL